MSLPEFSNLSLTARNVIPITAQCTVFAESEVITLVGEGKPMDEIAAGIQMAVAKRCFVMAKKAGATDAITLTGGCAKNAGLKQAIERVLKLKVIDLKTDPQLMGALGAAEYARQKGMATADHHQHTHPHDHDHDHPHPHTHSHTQTKAVLNRLSRPRGTWSLCAKWWSGARTARRCWCSWRR